MIELAPVIAGTLASLSNSAHLATTHVDDSWTVSLDGSVVFAAELPAEGGGAQSDRIWYSEMLGDVLDDALSQGQADDQATVADADNTDSAPATDEQAAEQEDPAPASATRCDCDKDQPSAKEQVASDDEADDQAEETEDEAKDEQQPTPAAAAPVVDSDSDRDDAQAPQGAQDQQPAEDQATLIAAAPQSQSDWQEVDQSARQRWAHRLERLRDDLRQLIHDLTD